MKLTELIIQLQRIQAQYGDITVLLTINETSEDIAFHGDLQKVVVDESHDVEEETFVRLSD